MLAGTPQEEMCQPITMPPLPSDDKRWKIVNGTDALPSWLRAGQALIETLHTKFSLRLASSLTLTPFRFVAKSLRVPC